MLARVIVSVSSSYKEREAEDPFQCGRLNLVWCTRIRGKERACARHFKRSRPHLASVACMLQGVKINLAITLDARR